MRARRTRRKRRALHPALGRGDWGAIPRPSGIFDLDNQRNPFADHSIAYVPYCTGDAHLGYATTRYAPGLTVHHKGYVNGTAALDHLATIFPGATRRRGGGPQRRRRGDAAVCRTRVGSAPRRQDHGAGGRIGRFPPDLADSSGRLAAAWGTGNAIPAWPENAGLTAKQWTSVIGLFIQSGRHDPEIVFARHDYAYDATQQPLARYLGVPPKDLLSVLDRYEMRIEGAGVNLLSYIAPGDSHGALQYESFYIEEVNGEKLVDWVTRLIKGEPVTDVHCKKCTAG